MPAPSPSPSHLNVRQLAAAALLLPCVAAPVHAQQADGLTLYGLYDAAVRHSDKVNATGGRQTVMEDGIITGTRLGFRGRESLGGGLAAVFTAEAGIDPSTGLSLQGTATADYGQVASTTRFFGREVHVGLRAPWGGVSLGRQYTLAHALAARFQPLGNPNSVAHSLFSSHHIARQDNLLRLDARVAGVDLSATHTLGEQTAGDANSSWAVGAGFSRPEFALAAYVQQMNNLAGTETRRIIGAGGNAKVGARAALYGGVMQRSSELSPQKNRAWTLGANLELGPKVTLSVAHFDDQQSGSTALNGKRSVSWVTASYRFSRRTDVYALVGQNRVTGGYARPAFMGTLGTQTNLATGLRTRF